MDDVSLEVKEGENWVILGRNGSGKTTILEMMTGYLFPSKGTVEVLGYKYGQCDIREVRKEIGYIGPSLMEKMSLNDPVWEVVATGAYAYLRFYETILRSKRESNQHAGRYESRQYGISSFWDLVTGERKKAMLARCLMADPKLLIMDEPCAGLDLYEREKMLAEIDKLRQRNVSVVYVTHHVEEIVPLFTHVALIREGKLAGSGPKEEVLTKEMILATYDIPVDVEWDSGRPWIKIRPGGKTI